jgi:hypothetical protein
MRTTAVGVVTIALLAAWGPGGVRAQKEEGLSPVERIGRMKADDPNVPARIDKAMNDLQAKARQLGQSLQEVHRQLLQLEEMRRAHLARQQRPAREAPAADDRLGEILRRLEQIQRRLDRLEGKAAEPPSQKK